MSLRVHLKRQVKQADVDPLGLKRYAKAVLRSENLEDGAVTIVLTDDQGIHELNLRFRDRDQPTDVLSFPLHEEDELGIYLGDVIISVERARAQAPRFHNDPERELARLIAHGILHLLGFDHHTPPEGKKMKAAERRALANFLPGSLWPLAAGEDRA